MSVPTLTETCIFSEVSVVCQLLLGTTTLLTYLLVRIRIRRLILPIETGELKSKQYTLKFNMLLTPKQSRFLSKTRNSQTIHVFTLSQFSPNPIKPSLYSRSQNKVINYQKVNKRKMNFHREIIPWAKEEPPWHYSYEKKEKKKQDHQD